MHLCFCLFGGLQRGIGFPLAFTELAVALWSSFEIQSEGVRTFSPPPLFFLFPFLSFEFSFLKRFLLLNSGMKGWRFHFLWAKSPCTGVCVNPVLAVVFFSLLP